MGWGDILHNALKDTEGLVDPRTYYRTGKFAVENPVGFGKAVGKSYVDLAEHPVRTLQKHPVDTLLQFAPAVGGLGKLADIGAEGAFVKALNPSYSSIPGGPEAMTEALSGAKSAVPGVRASRLAKTFAGDAHARFQGVGAKYKPAEGPPISHFAGSVPGVKVNQARLEQLMQEHGNPNAIVKLAYAKGYNLQGHYTFPKQTVEAHVQPEHLMYQDPSQIVNTILHETRHAQQHMTTGRLKRTIDSFRHYDNQHQEIDARKFADANQYRYSDLVHMVEDQRVPVEANTPFGLRAAHSIDKQVKEKNAKDLWGLLDEVGTGSGPSEEQFLKHMEQLVGTGELDRNDAIDIQEALQHSYNTGKTQPYTPPKSPQELFQRAADKAKLSRKEPTFNGSKAAGIRASFDSQFRMKPSDNTAHPVDVLNAARDLHQGLRGVNLNLETAMDAAKATKQAGQRNHLHVTREKVGFAAEDWQKALKKHLNMARKTPRMP